MEFDQILQRLDWLDNEHRKDKVALEAMADRLKDSEGEIKAATKKIKELTLEISKFSNISTRIDEMNGALSQQRQEIIKYAEELNNKDAGKLPEAEKRFQIQINNLNKTLLELQKLKEPLAEIKRELKDNSAEETRHNNQIAKWEARIEDIVKDIDEIRLAQKATEGPRRQDRKRLAELQGAVNSARKRMDEVSAKNEIFPDSIRRIETRLNEIVASEAERRQAQTGFIEAQSLQQIERDRAMKEMEQYLVSIRNQTSLIDHQLQEWDEIQRNAKRVQETYEEIVRKFERRINEISEMQRLAEDRFRQEWVTFRADDQKRWTSFTLSQDEIQKDTKSVFERLEERLTILEDRVQMQQDVLQQTKEANEQLFQGMLAQIHELLTSYEQIMSTK